MNFLIQPKTEEFSQEKLKSIMNEIIKPDYKRHIDDWLFDARVNERKGVFIVSQIIKYKGLKTFKSKLDQSEESEELTLENAYKRYQKKALCSSYQDEYCHTVDPKFKYNNILKFRKFDFINYSEMIINKYSEFITKWALIEEAEQYKEYVLDFVRSFYSTVKSNKPNYSAYTQFYENPKQTDLYSKHGCFMPEVFPKKNLMPTLDEMRERLNLDASKKRLENLKPIKYNDLIQANEDVKQMKQVLINGNKNMLKGIFPNTLSTTYLDLYKGQQDKKNNKFTKPDFYTSGIKGKVPDPYEMNRMNRNDYISEDLKNKVNGILLKSKN